MKPGIILTLSFLLCITACNNKEKTATTVAADGTITETTLPRGRFIIDDETAITNIPQNPGTLNGINGQNDNPAKDPVKESPEANLRRRYKNLLVFHADDTMTIKKSYLVTLIMAKDQILEDVKEAVLENSNATDNKTHQDTTLEIGNTMKAKLKPLNEGEDKGFDIDYMGDEETLEQKITEKRKQLMWQWKITPLKPGEQKLLLTITVKEKDEPKINLPVRNIPVIIFAEPESIMSKVGSFFEKNYQWVLATLLLPLFLGWYNARMRHKFDIRMAQEREQRERQQPQQPATDASKSSDATSS